MFAWLSLMWLIQIVTGFFLPDRPVILERVSTQGKRPLSTLNQPFKWIFTANMLVSIAFAVTSLGNPLSMNNQGITLTIITLVAAVQSGLGLITSPIVGSLSDRIGQRTMLLAAFGGMHFVPYTWLHRTRIYLALSGLLALGSFYLLLQFETESFTLILAYIGLLYCLAALFVCRLRN
jgi:MFS family permease